jgi:hypothetical protein
VPPICTCARGATDDVLVEALGTAGVQMIAAREMAFGARRTERAQLAMRTGDMLIPIGPPRPIDMELPKTLDAVARYDHGARAPAADRARRPRRI